MKAFLKELELIALVNNNYEHIQQLETLANHYRELKESEYTKEYPSDYNLTQKQIDELFVIAKTTHNAHYNMELFTDIEFQIQNNTVDSVLKELGIKPIPSYKELYHKTKFED